MSDFERRGWENALYNMDQLPGPVGTGSGEYSKGYKEGLRRGVVEALCMVLGYEHNVNEIWNRMPVTIERGKAGRYND